MKQALGTWTLEDAYESATLRGRGGNFMRPPSVNALITGDGVVRAFKGVTAQGGKSGSRLLYNVDQTYGGIGTASGGAVSGGSLFRIRQLLAAISQTGGQVRFDGADVAGFVASQTLSFIKKTGGVYTGFVYQAGHAQPSAPTVYAKAVPSAGQTPMTGAVVVWIWRVCSVTGQVSLFSLPSNDLTLTAQSVIVQFPGVDLNGQDLWGIGVPLLGFADLGVPYELPISLGGEVAEAALAYTRALGSATIVGGTNQVDAAGAAFTSADIGRRVTIGAYDSFVTQINSGTQVLCNDDNTSGGDITAAGTVTHAVDGYLRSVEISWTNGALIKANLAPDKAFPPPAGQFAGVMNDTLWVESDAIILIGEPGQTGSFPPKNSLFPNEPAVSFLKASDNVTLRWGKHSLGALLYVGGSPAIEYQVVYENAVGIALPQNAAVGAPGRVLAWLGQPAVFTNSGVPDFEFAQRVMPDFAGWDQQSADKPVVPNYDPKNNTEVWCFGKKVMGFRVGRDKWCAPVDLTGKVGGDIVGAAQVILGNRQTLLLCCLEGASLVLYEYDAGAGSVMVVQVDDVQSPAVSDTISGVQLQARPDTIGNHVKVEIVVNMDDANPVTVHDAAPPRTGAQHISPYPPNILNAQSHAMRVTMTSAGGDCGVERMETFGEPSAVAIY